MPVIDPALIPLFTIENLVVVNAAILSGAKEIQYGDKRIVYQSTAQLLIIRNLILQELGLSNTAKRKYPTFGKGLL